MTGSLLNGANFRQIAKSTFMGALVGGAGGFLNFASGDGTLLEQLFKHAFSECWLEGLQGGNMLHGFIMGAVSGAGGYAINNYGQELGRAGKIASSAVLGGVVSYTGY